MSSQMQTCLGTWEEMEEWEALLHFKGVVPCKGQTLQAPLPAQVEVGRGWVCVSVCVWGAAVNGEILSCLSHPNPCPGQRIAPSVPLSRA